jgi:hypothetical protein
MENTNSRLDNFTMYFNWLKQIIQIQDTSHWTLGFFEM